MIRNSFHRFFPTPKFLVMHSFGLDISDESMKFVELNLSRDGMHLGKYGERAIPAGIIESGKIKDPSQMSLLLKNLANEEGIQSVRVSLPEEQIYLFGLHLDKAGLKNIREGIELSLEEHVPIPAPDAIFDYEIVSEDAKGFDLQVAAIPKNVIENYLTVFHQAGIHVQSLELEAQAVARAVIENGDKDTYMIVDFGEKRSGIFIVSKGVVMFTSTLDVGGATLTSMIEKTFKIGFEEAEKMKKDFGLQRNVENKEIFSVLLNSVSILRDELSKHFIYWHTHKNEEGNNNPPIKKIILCGGDSNLIGLSDYLSVSLKTTVEMANVWSNIVDTKNYIPEIGFKQALSFASAIGLALGDFEDN